MNNKPKPKNNFSMQIGGRADEVVLPKDLYFENRWFNKEGKPNVQQIMADKYLLENREKIFSKIANEAASQRLLAHLKKNGNININQTPTPQGAKPDLNGIEAERLRMAEWAFSS
jgi:hypothetical protein